MRNLSLIAVVVLALTGCMSNLESRKISGTDLSPLKSFYVQKRTEDERGIDRLIADRLTLMGFTASHGTDGPSAPVDAIVTYQDKWWWDLTMYMIQLDLQIRDAHTKMVLANGQSMRTSFIRKSADEMVEEVLTEVFKGVRR